MPESLKFHYGYIIVLCCCLIMGINMGLVMSCAGIFYKPVSMSLQISVGTFGWYMTFIYVFSTLMLTRAGKLLDTYSARWLLSLSSGLLGIVLLSMSAYSAVWQFYLAGAVIGITLAFLLYLSYPTLMNRWFNSNVGFFIGLCSAASGIGGVVFNPMGGHLIAQYGWRNTYIIFGAIVLFIVTPVLALFLRDYPGDKGLLAFGEKKEKAIDQGVEYSIAITSKAFFALIAFAFLMISVSTINLFLPAYVVNIGFSVEQSAFVASAIMLGVTVGKMALGYVNDRNPRLGIVVSSTLGIAGFILFLLGKEIFIMVAAGGFFFGWAYAAVTVQTALLVRTVFGSRDYAKIFSNISIALSAGGALMAGGWGFIADIIDFKYILSTGIVLLLIAALLGFYAMKHSKQFMNGAYAQKISL